MEYLQFIFSGFWIWVGTAILLLVVTGGLASFLRTIFARTSWSVLAPQIEASITKAVRNAKESA